MLDIFKKSMTVCAAVTAFSSGAVVVLNGVNSILESKVNSVLTSKPEPSESSDVPVVGSVLKGARSVTNALIR